VISFSFSEIQLINVLIRDNNSCSSIVILLNIIRKLIFEVDKGKFTIFRIVLLYSNSYKFKYLGFIS